MDGTVLAAEQEGNLHKDGVAGPHTHTVLTGQTPLVRHMHVVSIAAGKFVSQLYIADSFIVGLHAPCCDVGCHQSLTLSKPSCG